MARWWTKVPNYKPPRAQIDNVYQLRDKCRGGVVYVLAPGPSYDDFPQDMLLRVPTIGVNSIAERISPDFWMFQEGIFCKKYHPIYTTRWIKNIVTTRDRCLIIRDLLPEKKGLYSYRFLDMSVLGMEVGDNFPFWSSPEEEFIPGRNSIAANAMSLAVLMNPKLIVLVGVDLRKHDGRYYCEGIRKNRGPRLQERALSASRAWMTKAARKGVWRGPEIVTTSPLLSLRGVRRVSIDVAIQKTKEILS